MGMHTPADWLEQARAGTDGVVLHRLARSPYVFVRQALAANPATEPGTLLELAVTRDRPWKHNRLLAPLAEHPRADRAVLRAVLDVVAARLGEGERPYAAVLALADRAELAAAEVRELASLPGASARLRSGLERRLAFRTSP